MPQLSRAFRVLSTLVSEQIGIKVDQIPAAFTLDMIQAAIGVTGKKECFQDGADPRLPVDGLRVR